MKVARKIFERVVAIFKMGLGEKSIYYAKAVSNFGYLYLETGKYDEEEEHFTNALGIARSSGLSHEDIVRKFLNNLADLYLRRVDQIAEDPRENQDSAMAEIERTKPEDYELAPVFGFAIPNENQPAYITILYEIRSRARYFKSIGLNPKAIGKGSALQCFVHCPQHVFFFFKIKENEMVRDEAQCFQ